jgi:hypothetical protein
MPDRKHEQKLRACKNLKLIKAGIMRVKEDISCLLQGKSITPSGSN